MAAGPWRMPEISLRNFPFYLAREKADVRDEGEGLESQTA
jgi:hypothetical protein